MKRQPHVSPLYPPFWTTIARVVFEALVLLLLVGALCLLLIFGGNR